MNTTVSSPGPQEVIRHDDGELMGYVHPCDGQWLPTTVFGAPLGTPTSHADAEAHVLAVGLAVLAEKWWFRDGGEWYSCLLQEASPERVRIQVTDYGHPAAEEYRVITGDDLGTLARRPR
ncbi:hypothetical protein EV193_1208 [Herbihabitans rhizosphaerae]|uniref:Uncharacterized protein n=1 Tax=Herbihabitans rhizosphaerae TaxID=1872711 RepID=A0A4Q7KB70_9PSEU|nr:hypothetical protein [Herbihabitans rhizosphaerae]RZS29523.1 hypothetical protein EV193_1208 [Herbihabitans rhizosphaerae]